MDKRNNDVIAPTSEKVINELIKLGDLTEACLMVELHQLLILPALVPLSKDANV